MKRGSLGWLGAGVLGLLAAAGCKSKSNGGGDAPKPGAGTDVTDVVNEGESIKSEEDELLKKRNALQREKQSLVENLEKAAEDRKAAEAGGKKLDPDKAEELAKKDAENIALQKKILASDEELNQKIAELSSKKTSLVDKATAVVSAGGGGGGGAAPDLTAAVARREGQMAGREKDLAEREKDLAAREASLSKRELELAKGCVAQGGGNTIIMQAPGDNPKGVKYSRHDVEPVYDKALRLLSSKGILDGDLPPGVANLKDDTRKAMETGDFGKAKYAADQLYAVAGALKIDRGFLSAKFSRLNAAMRGKTLSPEGKGLFQEATANYSDGNFPSANQKLNKLFAMLR